VSELDVKYGTQLKVAALDATTSENAPKQSPLGFQSHGLVIHDAEGKVVFSQADHAVNKDEVTAFVAKNLKPS